MSAEFIASGSFVLPSRSCLVIHGTIKNGLIQKGMVINHRASGLRLRVDAVEFLDRLSNQQSEIALCVRYADEEELSTWQGVNFESCCLQIEGERG